MELYPYQKKAIAAVWQFFKDNPSGGAPLIVAPTGAGKSFIIAKIIETIIKQRPSYRTIVVSHRKEIIDQNARELQSLLPSEPIGIWSAGLGKKRLSRVTYGNIQSIYKTDIPKTDLVIVDECHLFPPSTNSMYRKFTERIFKKNPRCKVLGLTATPYRLDSGSLLDFDSPFTDIAYDICIRELIEQGFLSPLISRVSESIVDLSSVKKSGYDYNQAEAEAAFDPETEKHCEEIIAKGADRKHWLIFCSGVKHAEHTASALRAKGVTALAVHGELLDMERDRRINEFKAGRVQAITNCNILTTGFNVKQIDLLVLLRATKSTALFVQMVGRGTRTAPGKKDCLVLDFGNNIKTHGPIDLIKVKTVKGKKAEISKMPAKTCPMCGCVVFVKTQNCPSCEYEFPAATQKLEPVASNAPIMADIKELEVESWNTKTHQKEGKPDSFRIDFQLKDHGRISEFLCFQHGGFAAQQAKRKWAKLARDAVTKFPETAQEAHFRSYELRKPSRISVIKDGKYYRISSMRFEQVEEEII